MKLEINREELESVIHLGDVTDPCPYLPGQEATFRFGNGHLASGHYEQLLDWGYRRNGTYVYRPVCSACQECWVLRVPVATFKMTKSQRRVWNKGLRSFSTSVGSCHFSDEKAKVYERYLAFQHEGEEGPVTEARYRPFLVDSCLRHETMEIQYRVDGQLAGVGVIDRLRRALSTVYFYFDPDFAPLSPGTWSALFEIQLARAWHLDYYYMGYFIPGCGAMNYKARFQPCELKQPDTPGWIPYQAGRFSK
jgi:arginine-tRNA-protein transferase